VPEQIREGVGVVTDPTSKMKQTPRARLGNAIGAVLALMTGGVAVAFAAVAFGLGGHGLFHQGLNPIFPNAGGSELHLPAADEISAGGTPSNRGPDQRLGNPARPTGAVAEAPDVQSGTSEPDPAPQEGGVDPEGKVSVKIDGPLTERPGSGGDDEPPAAPNDPGETPAGGQSDDTTRDGASNDPTKDESEDDGKSKPAKARPGADEPRQTEDDGEGDDDSASNGTSNDEYQQGNPDANSPEQENDADSDDTEDGPDAEDSEADEDSDEGAAEGPDDNTEKTVIEPAASEAVGDTDAPSAPPPPDAADGSTAGSHVAPLGAAQAAADASAATAAAPSGTSAADAGFGS
jgi:hypothetical protein